MDPYGLIGQVLDGQFRVDAYVGEGGFSAVYKGHHLGLEEPIAVKCLKLPPTLGSALVESFVRRFRDESRIQYRLSQGSLHVCRSIASGTTIAPLTSALVPYMVLEWLEGRSLAQDFEVRRAQGYTGRPLVEAVRLLDPAVEALAYAHAQGVVHRDLNTGNLFLARTREGVRLKVLDFGVAKIVSDHALELGPRAQTIGQIRIFAPAYGAPEQFEDKLGPAGPWTDVYALALIVLEALRDRTVMEGEHLGEYAMKALDERVRPTPRTLGVPVGDEVEVTFARALSVNPRQRPQDAGELWGMLKNAMRRDAESGRAPHAGGSIPPRAPGGRPSAAPHVAVLPVGSSPAVEVLRPGSVVPPLGSVPPGAAPSRAPARTVRMSGVPDATGSIPPAPGVPQFGQSAPIPSGAGAAYGTTPPPGAYGAPGYGGSGMHGAASGMHGTPPAGYGAPPGAHGAYGAASGMHQGPYGTPSGMHGYGGPPGAQGAPSAGALPVAPMAAGSSPGDRPSQASPLAASFADASSPGPWGSAPPAHNPPAPFPGAQGSLPPAAEPAGKVVPPRAVVAGVVVVVLAALAGVAYGVHRATAGGTSAGPSAPSNAGAAPRVELAPAAAELAAGNPGVGGSSSGGPGASPSVAPGAAMATGSEGSPGMAQPTASAPGAAPAGQPPQGAAPPAQGAAPPQGAPAPLGQGASTQGAPTPLGQGAPAALGQGAPAPVGQGAPGTGVAAPAATDEPRPFDRAAAKGALDLVNGILASCRRPGGTSGPGSIAVTFRPDGAVERAAVDKAPYAGTPEALCVESRFRTAKIRPFRGANETIDYAFMVPK